MPWTTSPGSIWGSVFLPLIGIRLRPTLRACLKWFSGCPEFRQRVLVARRVHIAELAEKPIIERQYVGRWKADNLIRI